MKTYLAQVLLDRCGRPAIVFARGRLLYHLIEATDTIRLTTRESLRGLQPALYRNEPYPVKKAASYYLNHTDREITLKAKAILRSLVRRQKET